MPKPYVPLALEHFDDDRRLGIEDAEILVAELVLRLAAKELASDGRLSRLQARRALSGLPCIADPDGVVKALEAAELVEIDDDGAVELPDWRDWMQSRAEIEAYRQRQSEYGRLGGRPPKARRQGRPKGSATGTGKGDPIGDPRGEPDQPESHNRPVTDSDSDSVTETASAASPVSDSPPPVDGLAAAILGIDVDHRDSPEVDRILGFGDGAQ